MHGKLQVHPSDKLNSFRIAYKAAKSLFRAKLRHHRKENRELLFDSLDTNLSDPKKMFAQIRHFLGKPQSTTNSLLVDGVSYVGSDILDTWATYYESLLGPKDDPSFDPEHKCQVLDGFLHFNANCDPSSFIPFTVCEVQEATCSLPRGKAPGPDGIDGEHLIFGGTALSEHLAALFNVLLTIRYVPESFKTGYTVQFTKGPDKDIRIPSNYHGISLLSNVSKVFEKLILKRLLKVISLNPLQGGFREGLSCCHTSFILQEAIQSIRDSKRKAYVDFLDAQKAFDTVWHEGLFVKLIRSGVPRYLLELLRNWYSHSSCLVLWNGASSRKVSIKQDVRQGGILSPFQYSVFVDELLDILVSSQHGAFTGDVYVGAPMYADDLALVSESSTVLQNMLDIVATYARKW